MKNVTFVNTHLMPDERFGGVVYSGDGLLCGLARIHHVTAVTCSKEPKKVEEHYLSKKIKIHCFKSVVLHKISFSISMIFGLPNIIRKSDFVAINGIFTFPVTYSALLCIIFKVPFSVALRGGYEPWRMNQKKIKKNIFNFFVTNRILRESAFIHVISDMEADSVPVAHKSKAVVIPNGFDMSTYEKYRLLESKFTYEREKEVKFLFLSRMDKEKGLDIVFSAFKDIQSRSTNTKLTLVGPDNNGYLKNLIKTVDNVEYEWIPGLYGDDKILEIIKADVFILPSYSENFGNVILESLLFGTPVITSTGTPWGKIVPEIQCGWICQPEKESFLNECLASINTDRKELINIGARGQDYIKANYSWDSIALSFSNQMDIN